MELRRHHCYHGSFLGGSGGSGGSEIEGGRGKTGKGKKEEEGKREKAGKGEGKRGKGEGKRKKAGKREGKGEGKRGKAGKRERSIGYSGIFRIEGGKGGEERPSQPPKAAEKNHHWC